MSVFNLSPTEMASKTKQNYQAALSEGVTMENAAKTCTNLAKQKMYGDLEAFLKTLPNNADFIGNEDIVKAKIACLLAKKKYKEIYKLISVSPLQDSHFERILVAMFLVVLYWCQRHCCFHQDNTFTNKKEMILLWDNAHCEELGASTPLERFRVRER